MFWHFCYWSWDVLIFDPEPCQQLEAVKFMKPRVDEHCNSTSFHLLKTKSSRETVWKWIYFISTLRRKTVEIFSAFNPIHNAQSSHANDIEYDSSPLNKHSCPVRAVWSCSWPPFPPFGFTFHFLFVQFSPLFLFSFPFNYFTCYPSNACGRRAAAVRGRRWRVRVHSGESFRVLSQSFDTLPLSLLLLIYNWSPNSNRLMLIVDVNIQTQMTRHHTLTASTFKAHSIKFFFRYLWPIEHRKLSHSHLWRWWHAKHGNAFNQHRC